MTDDNPYLNIVHRLSVIIKDNLYIHKVCTVNSLQKIGHVLIWYLSVVT